MRGAWRLGDPAGGEESPGEILARIREMSLWEGTQALFVAATEPVPATADGPGVLVDTIDLDVRRTLEEARDRRLPRGSHAAEVPRLGPGRVARELLAWGLESFALELLREAGGSGSRGAGEDMLLGYLSAERDPQEAAARLRRASQWLSTDHSGSGWGEHADALLAALLLEVRSDAGRARHAWAAPALWLESVGDAWIDTSRRAAVLYELAARAGETGHADRLRDRLLRLSGPDDALGAWVRTRGPLRGPERVA